MTPSSVWRRLDHRAKKWLSLLTHAAGLAMLVVAVGFALRSGDRSAIEILRAAPPWAVVLTSLLAGVNSFIVAISFLVLTRQFARVGLGEMLALVGGAWLLNYLPMRPGLIGRVAYHKKYNAVAVKDSLRVLVVAGAGTVIAAAHIGLLAGAHLLGLAPAALGGVWVGSIVVVAGGLVIGLGQGWSGGFELGRLWMTLALRYLDVFVWAARYACAGVVLGVDLSLTGACFLAAVSQVAFLIPLVGNGLGLREWTTGLATESTDVLHMSGSGLAGGVQLELINRVCEVFMAVPVGLVSFAWLAARTRRASRASASTP